MHLPDTVVTVCYLIAAILFIFSLGGLSAQESARRGNLFGIVGMAIAILATMWGHGVGNHLVAIVMLLVGGAIGAAAASRVQMTAMPQLVAILHSFVGAAAVLVGFAITMQGEGDYTRSEALIHRVETFVGIFVGAVTFTGSVIAYGKLQGVIRSKPLLLPGRHALNLAAVAICAVLGVLFVGAGGAPRYGRWSCRPFSPRYWASTS
jgi:H+-translocating NAD(P) transhydrogenase subunit beta